MKLVTISLLHSKENITVAVQDEDYDRFMALIREADELFTKREYIEQDYARVILAEDKRSIEEDHV